MSQCQIKLKEEGSAYPRTCSKCGLGTCMEGNDSISRRKTIEQLTKELIAAKQQINELEQIKSCIQVSKIGTLTINKKQLLKIWK